MYVYVNTTEAALQQNFTRLFELQERIRNGTGEIINLKVCVKTPWSGMRRFLKHPPPPPPAETEPLPPELQPLVAADDEDVNATDPIVNLFLKRQRRMKEVKKRREAGVLERLERFAVKKYYSIRRG